MLGAAEVLNIRAIQSQEAVFDMYYFPLQVLEKQRYLDIEIKL